MEQRTYTQERCECGALISGSSEKHIKGLLKIHKTSRKHKELMEIKHNGNKKK